MKANVAVARGAIRPGTEIWTFPMGEVPGGVWTVVEMRPDPAAPEIVFNVQRYDGVWDGPIGVFADEEIILL